MKLEVVGHTIADKGPDETHFAVGFWRVWIGELSEVDAEAALEVCKAAPNFVKQGTEMKVVPLYADLS